MSWWSLEVEERGGKIERKIGKADVEGTLAEMRR